MRKNAETLTLLVFAAVCCVLILVGMVSYYTNTSLNQSSAAVMRTLDSLRASGQVSADLSAAESAVYSYSLNRDDGDLLAYQSAERRLTEAMAELAQSISSTPEERQCMARLQEGVIARRSLFAQWLQPLPQGARPGRAVLDATAERSVTAGIEKQLMQIQRAERSCLEANQDAAQTLRFDTTLILWIAASLTLVLVVLAIFFMYRESHMRRRARQRVAAQFAATRLLSESVSLAQAARRLLPELSLTLEFDAAELWLLDGEGQLQCQEHWLSASVLPSYGEYLQQARLAGGESLAGKVYASQESCWVEELASSAGDPAAHEALEAGLRSAVAVPVLIWPDVAGAMLLYSRRVAPPDRDLYQTLTAIGAQLGQFITRRRTMESLANTTELQRAILQSANFSIIATDANGVIRIFNATAEKWLQYEAHGLIGKSTPVIFHRSEELESRASRLSEELGVSVEPGVEVLIAKARRGAIDENEWIYLRRDGSSFPVQLSVTALRDASGAATGFLLIGKDITERREIDRMKNEFVSIVSHELRTPLTSVRGSLGLLAAGLLGNVGDKAKRMLQIGINNTDRLVRLINDILDIERLESGKVSLERKPVSAEQILRQSIDTMRGMAEKSQVNLVRQPFDAAIYADADRIVQTLTNLIGNAIKFSQAGSTVELGGFSNSRQATLYVRDHGRGIPPEKHSMIFERFMQADASDAREKGGTGLGLAICRTIVEQHGGHIWVESTPGVGSVFYFTLPLVEEGPESAGQPSTGRPAKILVCDDDAWLRGIVSNLLRQAGFVPLLAATGAEMLQALRQERPDVLLLDLQLTDMQGWEALRQLRQLPGCERLPVIVLSGEAEAEARAKAPLAVDGWVQKPFDSKRLNKAILAVLEVPLPTVVLLGEETWRAALAEELQHRGVAAVSGEAAMAHPTLAKDACLLVLDFDDPASAARLEPFRARGEWKNLSLLLSIPSTMAESQADSLSWERKRQRHAQTGDPAQLAGEIREMLQGHGEEGKDRDGLQTNTLD
jgi:PAS domain S-box-containing protein